MAVQISGNDITVPRDGSFTRNVTIGGTLTYEDVTNIDSVGLVTARNGIEIGARPGVAASISVDGNMIVSGISTFGGDVQVPDKIIHSGDTNTAIRFPEADNFTVECAGNERFRVKPTNDIAVFTGSNSGSLTIRNDTSNEVQLHTGGSDALIFGTGGENERMRINSSGSLLVGTTSDAGKLCVQGAAGGVALQTTDATNSTFRISHPSSAVTLLSGGSSQNLALGTGFAEKMRITSAGYVGIGENSPDNILHVNSGNTNTAAKFESTDTEVSIQLTDTTGSAIIKARNDFRFDNSSGELARIDSSGRFGLGTNTPDTLLHLNASSGSTLQRFQTSSYSSYIAQIQSNDNVSNGSLAGQLHLRGQSGFSVSANNGTTTHLIMDSAGAISNNTTRTQGQTFVTLTGSGTSNFSVMVFGCNNGGHNTTSTAVALGRHSSNNRSLNAGGTLNSNGNDYAEYMTKSGDFTIAKGDICGIDANGKLTNKFSESISFVVKSTDPSYVGGDGWGSQEILGEKPADDSDDLPAYEAKMETARKMVDRIAFSGQVPVNVTGATAGQHIIPTEGSGDTITGVAKAEASLSMAEYMSSVGKVITLESDGRARIIVKVS